MGDDTLSGDMIGMMRIDEDAIARDYPATRPERGFCLLLLALCEMALENGISMIISNYESHMRRIYNWDGAVFDELGRTDGYGRLPVCYGAFEVSREVRDEMRQKLQVAGPHYRGGDFVKKETRAPLAMTG